MYAAIKLEGSIVVTSFPVSDDGDDGGSVQVVVVLDLNLTPTIFFHPQVLSALFSLTATG